MNDGTADRPTGAGTVTEERLPSPPTPQPLERRQRRLPLLLLGLVALSAMLALSISAFRGAVVYYLTPTEALAVSGDEPFRLSGIVVDDTLVFDTASGTVTFEVTDDITTIPVLFTGTAPDTLKDGAEAIAEGRFDADGTFLADTVLARCPSKFEAEIEHPDDVEVEATRP